MQWASPDLSPLMRSAHAYPTKHKEGFVNDHAFYPVLSARNLNSSIAPVQYRCIHKTSDLMGKMDWSIVDNMLFHGHHKLCSIPHHTLNQHTVGVCPAALAGHFPTSYAVNSGRHLTLHFLSNCMATTMAIC